MLTSSTKKRLGMALVGIALVGAGALTSPAKADPKQFGGVVGVGSDTVQDVFNAFTGYTNGVDYTPLHATTAGARQVISFDAIDPANINNKCISTVLGGPSFNRPNGSGAGKKALSRAMDGTGWSDTNCSTALTGNDVSGQIDFGRSSSGPAAGDLGTDLTYIPFGRDGVSFAWYSKNGTVGGATPAFNTLTKAELTAIYAGPATGTDITHGAVTVHITACGIQTSSGTYGFWNGIIGGAAAEAVATGTCNGNPLGRAEENSGDALKSRGDYVAGLAGHANDEVIIGFSAGSYVARLNGAAPMVGANTIGGIGAISDNGATPGVNLGSPISGTAPTLAPSATFFNDTTFGRNVYVVLPTTTVALAGNNDIKSLFVTTYSDPLTQLVPTTLSQVCQNGATIGKFGFLTIGNACGQTLLKGSAQAGHI
jgi:hypothetical protein